MRSKQPSNINGLIFYEIERKQQQMELENKFWHSPETIFSSDYDLKIAPKNIVCCKLR